MKSKKPLIALHFIEERKNLTLMPSQIRCLDHNISSMFRAHDDVMGLSTNTAPVALSTVGEVIQLGCMGQDGLQEDSS